jgi:hypothetical protein
MLWSADWAWGLPILVVTVVGHVCVLVIIGVALLRIAPRPSEPNARRRPVLFIVVVALMALAAACLLGLEAALWAWVYVELGALPDVRDALLYSLGAITSYGHVGIYLEDHWKLLGAIEAVDGLILFGLTTAFLFAAIQGLSPVRVSGQPPP